jgi:low temperature requirement protein LtrA
VSAQHQRVGWFELFYDLVIVATISYTAHTFIDDPTWSMGSWIGVSIFVMFTVWLLTTVNNNILPGDHQGRRLLALLQMLALTVAALGTVADEGLPNALGFGGLAVTFGAAAAMFAIALRSGVDPYGTSRLLTLTSGAAALILLAGVALPDDATWTFDGPAPWLFAAGVAVAAVPLFTVAVGRLHRQGTLDAEHLGERIGQLVIIVLGESFLSLVSELGGRSSIPDPVFFVLTFAVVFAVWTIYFSTVLPAGLPASASRTRLWLLAHWLLLVGAVGAASGFSALTVSLPEPAGTSGHVPWTTFPLFIVMVALALAALLGTGRTTPLIWLHLAAAAALLLLSAMGVLLSPGGYPWEVVAGSVIVIVDAVLCVRVQRPYAVSRPAGATR